MAAENKSNQPIITASLLITILVMIGAWFVSNIYQNQQALQDGQLLNTVMLGSQADDNKHLMMRLERLETAQRLMQREIDRLRYKLDAADGAADGQINLGS